MRYLVFFQQGDTNYSAYVPDLPVCVAVGDTLEETRQEISEAIKFHIACLQEDREVVPKPTSKLPNQTPSGILAEFVSVEVSKAQTALTDSAIKLLDVVALTQDVPEHNLKRGDVGTVVEILSNGEAFEVEFSDDNGQMSKCLSFLASQLRVIHDKPLSESDQKQEPARRKNAAAQRLIKTMEKPPHLTDEDIEALDRSIKEGEIPIKFDSIFERDEPKNNE